jgi:hypothetical protein
MQEQDSNSNSVSFWLTVIRVLQAPPPPPTCFFFASSSLLANSGSVRRLNRMATLVPLSMGSRGSFLNLWKQQQQSTPVVYHCTVCHWLRTAHVPVYSEWWNEGNLVLCKLLD